MKKLILGLAVLLTAGLAKAQVSMIRTSFSTPFVPIYSGTSNGGTLSTAAGDDNYQVNIPVGFTFNYLGTGYSSIAVSTNGWASFAGSITSSLPDNTSLFTTSTPNLMLAPWWDDLTSDSVVYKTDGAPGNQVFTIQWNSKSYWSGSSQLVKFQLKLYETTNVIEFHYGSVIPGSSSVSESASIGIENSVGGAGNYIDVITGSSFAGTAFLSTSTKWPTRFYRLTPGTPTPLSGGTYNVGTGQVYPTIDEAVADLNHRGISGPVTFALTQTMYDVNPSGGDNIFPVFIGNVNGASPTNSILIQPASATSSLVYDGASSGSGYSGNTSAFSTSSEPIIGLVGASFVTLNNLYFTTSTASGNTVDRGVGIVNLNAAVGSFSNTVKNATVSLNRSNTSSIGFETRTSTTPTIAAGANSFNNFIDVHVRNSYNGVLFSGTTAFPDLGNALTTSSPSLWNTIGGSNANDLGNGSSASYGVQAANQSGVLINNNVIQNITVNASVVSDGILMTGIQGTSLVHNNNVQNVRNNSTSATSGITGIRVSVATTGTHELRIYNNFVSGLTSGYTGAASATRQIKGIFAQTGGGGASTQTIIVIGNNVSINGSSSPNISSTAFEIGTSTGPVIVTRNNIFANFTGSQVAPSQHLAWFSTSATLIGNTGSSSNYNDLYIDNATEGYVGKGNTTLFATLSAWQAAMNQDANSVSCNPGFVGANDLHVTSTCLDGVGNLSGYAWVTTDIDNTPRSVTPDIGADEFVLCSGAVSGVANPANISLCSGQSTVLNVNGASASGGISYTWKFATVSGGPYSPATGSGSTSTTYNTGSLAPGNYFFVMDVVCAANSATATTNEVTVTVNPYPTLLLSQSATSICVPGSPSVNISATGATSYTWIPGAGLSSTLGANVDALPLVNTTYTVSGESLGCITTATAGINVSGGAVVHSVSATPSVICSGSNAQLQTLGYGGGLINTYSFSTGSGASLLTLSSPTVLVSSNVDDNISGVNDIGFIVNFNGQPYSQYIASPDGWVRFGGQAGTNQFSNSNTSTSNIPKLYPFWDDVTTGVDGNVRASLEGSAPTRTLVVEWFVTIPGNLSGNANSTYQALIHEATGDIEFRYGTMNATATSASSGMTGGSANYQAITFSTSATSTVSTSNSNAVTPASGTFFKFTPPSIVSWSPATFLSSTSVLSPTAIAATATTNYSVVITNAAGCSASGSVNLSVNPLPVVTVNDGTICAGQSFSIVPSGAVSYTYLPTGPVVSPTSNDTYTVTGEDANGCISAAVVSSVNVNPLPVLVVSAANDTICEGGSTALNVSGASSYTWSNGATTSVTAVTPSVTMTYTVDGETLGCVASETVEVVVNALPSVSLTAASANACVNGSTIALNGTPVGGVYTGSNVSNGVFTPGSAGTYTANYSYTDPNTSCSNSSTVAIVVNTAPSVSLTAASTTACVNGPTIALTGSPSGGAYSGTGVANGMFTPPATQGTYVAVYSYTDVVTGCDANANTSIVVSVCTDISKVNSSLSGLLVYPNPHTGMFIIELENGQEKNIVITDLSGRVIVAENTSKDVTVINLNNFANGVYFVKISSNNSVETIRVIKQ